MAGVYTIYLESPTTMCDPDRITFESVIDIEDSLFAELDDLSVMRDESEYPALLAEFLSRCPDWEQEFPGALVALLAAPTEYCTLSDHLNCEGFIVFKCGGSPAAIMRTGWHTALKTCQLIKG